MYQEEKRSNIRVLELFHGEKEAYFFEEIAEDCRRNERKMTEHKEEGKQAFKNRQEELEEQLYELTKKERRLEK